MSSERWAAIRRRKQVAPPAALAPAARATTEPTRADTLRALARLRADLFRPLYNPTVGYGVLDLLTGPVAAQLTDAADRRALVQSLVEGLEIDQLPYRTQIACEQYPLFFPVQQQIDQLAQAGSAASNRSSPSHAQMTSLEQSCARYSEFFDRSNRDGKRALYNAARAQANQLRGPAAEQVLHTSNQLGMKLGLPPLGFGTTRR